MQNTDNSHGELKGGIELLLIQQKMLDVQDKMTHIIEENIKITNLQKLTDSQE